MAAPERISEVSMQAGAQLSETGVLPELLSRLACPACVSTELTATADRLKCTQCDTEFPIYRNGSADIPWLFSDPESTLLEWKSRLNGFLHNNWAEQTKLRKAKKSKSLSALTKNRLSLLLEGRMTQRIQVSELLAPLDLECVNFDKGRDPASLLRSRVPKAQGLSSYYNNIFRDWCWDNGENEQQFEALKSVVSDIAAATLGATLTLGAGSGRLAYDIHRTFNPKLSVAIDINPLLMFAASKVMFGESVPLVEFPVAPLNEAAFAMNQECFAPKPLTKDAKFAFLFADGLNPPCADASFDTVITPWLIDIIPQNLRDFALSVNRLLPTGGQWINTGSLAFFHKDIMQCLSEEEAFEQIEKCGFEIIATDRRRIPYLQSPLSAHWRTESVLSFCARKTHDVEETRLFRHLPAWLIDTSSAVPGLQEFSVASSDHLLRAQILAAIDGKRSIDDIGTSLAREYGLKQAEAQNAVRRILMDLYETQAQGTPDGMQDLG